MYITIILFLLLISKIWLLLSVNRSEHYAYTRMAHFGGVPNDSQLWGEQIRSIF